MQSKASGGVGHRLWYATTRVVVTRTDTGRSRFNFSEFAGNATAVALSNAYYPESRTAGSEPVEAGRANRDRRHLKCAQRVLA